MCETYLKFQERSISLMKTAFVCNLYTFIRKNYCDDLRTSIYLGMISTRRISFPIARSLFLEELVTKLHVPRASLQRKFAWEQHFRLMRNQLGWQTVLCLVWADTNMSKLKSKAEWDNLTRTLNALSKRAALRLECVVPAWRELIEDALSDLPGWKLEVYESLYDAKRSPAENAFSWFVDRDGKLKRTPEYKYISRCTFLQQKDLRITDSDIYPGVVNLPPDIPELELFETTTMGIGVRALRRFEKGDLMGEFVGEVWENSLHDISDNSHYYIAGTEDGNWRLNLSIASNYSVFINHSCDNNCYTRLMHDASSTIRILIFASRSIGFEEELFINYGSEYWRTRECLCGSTQCMRKS